MTDQTNLIHINERQPAKPGSALPPALRPAQTGEVIALLTACLALVRPVGMPQAEAEDWLAVAAGLVGHYPPDILAESCLAAQRTCTHHGQIVPAILKAGDEWLASRRKLVRSGEPMAPAPQLAAPAPWVPDQDELEAIKREAAERLKAER